MKPTSKLHNNDIIEAHEDQLNTLVLQGDQRNKRLTAVEKKVEEGFILIFEALGIREKTNGERRRQIQEAFNKISEVKQHTDNEDKSLRDLLIENKVELAEIKGFIKGQDKREKIEHNHDIDIENTKNLWYNKWQTWFSLAVLVVAVFTIIVTVIR